MLNKAFPFRFIKSKAFSFYADIGYRVLSLPEGCNYKKWGLS